MRIFYFIADDFPAWRVDLVELFAVQLDARGVETVWQTRRREAGWPCRATMRGQTALLPLSLGKSHAIGKLVNRLFEPLSECAIFLRLVFGKRFDIIQVRDDRYTAAFFALLAARLRRSRFTCWLSFPFPEHDLAMAKSASGARKWYLLARGNWARWWLYRRILPAADHVFVQSRKMKENLVVLGIDAEKMTPVPMGIPPRLLDFFGARKPEVHAGRIIYLGTLAASRHLETLVEAFAIVHRRYPHTTLLMVGEGDFPQERKQLEQLAARLEMGDAVRFTGFVPMEEAWELVLSAAVCISPFVPSAILDVGSPTKLIEYMALAKATVANRHPEQTPVLEESGAGTLVDWGAQEFANGIAWILDHPDAAAAMANKGPAWVRANRSYDRIAEAVLDRYVKLLSPGGAGDRSIDIALNEEK